MGEYVLFKEVMDYLIEDLNRSGSSYDSSLISSPFITAFPGSENYDKNSKEKNGDNKVNQVVFNQDDLTMSWSYSPQHKAMWQSLYIRRSTPGGLEKMVKLKEADHNLRMSVEEDGKSESIAIPSYSVQDLCSKIKSLLCY